MAVGSIGRQVPGDCVVVVDDDDDDEEEERRRSRKP